MTIREQLEERETKNLSRYAALSRETKGRVREEPQCDTALQGFPAAEAKDAGVSSAQRRSLQDKTDTYSGSVAECKNHCKGSAPE